MPLRKLSAKKSARKAQLRGAALGTDMSGYSYDEARQKDYAKRLAERPVDPRVALAADLVAIAKKEPPRKRGRPKEAVAPVMSRQERRYRERMLAKAQEAWNAATGSTGVAKLAGEVWDEVTDGAGVVLVDGKEVALEK